MHTVVVVEIADGQIVGVSTDNSSVVKLLVVDYDFEYGAHEIDGQECTITKHIADLDRFKVGSIERQEMENPIE